jgi:hypothetical protein
MRYAEPSAEQEAGWKEWVASRPHNVRVVAERFEPWSLYRMKSTNQRVTLVSFGEQEDGKVTLTVNVAGDFNFVVFDRQVFGIDPDDLEPCDLPPRDAITGALLTEEAAINEYVDSVRGSAS